MRESLQRKLENDSLTLHELPANFVLDVQLMYKSGALLSEKHSDTSGSAAE